MKITYESSYKDKNHFSFGKNWQNFLKSLNEEKVENAKISLVHFLGSEEEIKDKTFVDIGCGSGLFSLAAYQLGASRVVSVDIDEFSVACVKYLKEKQVNSSNWEIQYGSALDKEYIKSLKEFDIVYSWGVLHHTGNMYEALANITHLAKKEGKIYLALYNKFNTKLRGGTSETWLKLKKIYNKSGKPTKIIFNLIYAGYVLLMRAVFLQNPIKYVRNYKLKRGMSFFTDIKDWLGGYPYEFASTDEIINFFGKRGILCKKLKSVNGTGCNEFLFVKN